MAKEDILLRATSNPPLTTKGSALTWAELDANWIEIYDAFVALSQSSYVAAYSASVTYDDTIINYAMYSNQLWKCIAASPIIAITPTDGVNWTKVYATDFVGRSQSYEIKRTITADEINSGFSNEIEIIKSFGTAYFSEITFAYVKFNYGTIPFDATTMYIKHDGVTTPFLGITGINGSASFFKRASSSTGDVSANAKVVAAFNADGTSSPLGDSTIDIYLTYKVRAI